MNALLASTNDTTAELSPLFTAYKLALARSVSNRERM